ncbi:MAG: 50S ribosomal protein L5 [Candidatus Daviesbacteria bacterium]|nr:50S ribosomal protein L5 [Candidatus Daviesbacteria bacterium]
MARLKEKYQKEIMPKLKEEFGIKNNMAVPKITKIVINVGTGDAKDNQEIIDKVAENLSAMSGQKPVATKAKVSISGFKLSEGTKIGVMVTLRGKRMYEFLDKLITVVLPKVRDFRGISGESFDSQGNYSLGMREQTLFPEVNYKNTNIGGKTRGLEISIVATAKNRGSFTAKEQGKKLLELLGMPFKKAQ